MTTPIDGWKTYAIAALGIIVVGVFYLRGDLSPEAALPAMLGLLGIGTLRHAISTKETQP